MVFLWLRCVWLVSVYTTCIRKAHHLLFWYLLMHALVVYQKKKKSFLEPFISFFKFSHVHIVSSTGVCHCYLRFFFKCTFLDFVEEIPD